MVHDVKTDTLKENDIILVKAGEKVAADEVILEGESYLNESMLTGESKPVHKVRGTTLLRVRLMVMALLKLPFPTGLKMLTYRRLLNWWTMPKKSKSQTQLLADTAAKWLTVIALVTGIGTILY